MGETTVVEGSTLHLFCDGTPQPTLHWISPNGKVVGESGELTIVNVTRNMTGTYTCVATLPGSTATMGTSVGISYHTSKLVWFSWCWSVIYVCYYTSGKIISMK